MIYPFFQNPCQIDVRELSLGYGTREILNRVSFSVCSGEILSLLGANGKGKTTLLKAICGLLNPNSGEICINGKNLIHHDRKELAGQIAFVPQNPPTVASLNVRDMAVLGRIRFHGVFSGPNQDDYDYVDTILSEMGIDSLKERSFLVLSGGEQRLVLIARALVQNARFIILDEPVSNLDLGNQVLVLETLKKLASSGIGIIFSSHFPEHSLWLKSRTVLIGEGSVVSSGDAGEVINTSMMSRLYGRPINVYQHENGSVNCEPEFAREVRI